MNPGTPARPSLRGTSPRVTRQSRICEDLVRQEIASLCMQRVVLLRFQADARSSPAPTKLPCERATNGQKLSQDLECVSSSTRGTQANPSPSFPRKRESSEDAVVAWFLDGATATTEGLHPHIPIRLPPASQHSYKRRRAPSRMDPSHGQRLGVPARKP